jgi:hypothetical protein
MPKNRHARYARPRRLLLTVISSGSIALVLWTALFANGYDASGKKTGAHKPLSDAEMRAVIGGQEPYCKLKSPYGLFLDEDCSDCVSNGPGAGADPDCGIKRTSYDDDPESKLVVYLDCAGPGCRFQDDYTIWEDFTCADGELHFNRCCTGTECVFTGGVCIGLKCRECDGNDGVADDYVDTIYWCAPEN